MRRISRLRTPAVAGFCPSSAPIAPLRAPIPSSASTLPKHTSSSPIRLPQSQTRRHLSTTPARSSDEALLPEETTPAAAEGFKTALVYPSSITDAAAPSAVTDASYIPAETADGLEEVGGLADWWEDPSHGATSTVRATARPFGPADGTKVLDPAVLEVLARRAVIEALVVGRFVSAGGNQGKKVDQLFAGSANPEEGLQRIVKAEVVVGEEGVATLGDFRDWQRVWDLLRLGVKRQGKKEGAEAVEAAAASGLTPELATELVQSWGMGWRKAELRDPVVKFFAAKRIQQLTGHRIPDGKLCGIKTIDGLLKQLVEPPKALKLAELVETKGVFKEISNVRVFPRRVTPIDKEKMVGRWKIIVRELEKRELPLTGTGEYSEAVEKKWIEGRA